MHFDLLNVQMRYMYANASIVASPSVPQGHYCIQDLPTRAQR